MQDADYTIRTMTRQEVDLAIEWAAVEGWNPGLFDADCYFAADPSGFLVGLLDDEPIATISAVKYGQGFSFLGFFIVRPEHRGRGYGLRIWNAALERLAGRTVGLDGVVAQQENYKKSGFGMAYRNIRYEGLADGSAAASETIVPVSSRTLDEILAYDAAFSPDDRTAFIKAWINHPQHAALAVLDGGRLAGYGVIRACRRGHKIGPLFADRPEQANLLFAALKSQAAADEPIYLDVPEVNRAAVELAERSGMHTVFETARMYNGPVPPPLPLDRLFGVTSFELG